MRQLGLEVTFKPQTRRVEGDGGSNHRMWNLNIDTTLKALIIECFHASLGSNERRKEKREKEVRI